MSSAVFGRDYAAAYDELYQDKDYQGEADYVLRLIRKFHPKAKTLLDMGCGTGKHAALFKDAGYDVCGVDMSEMMLDRARLNPNGSSLAVGHPFAATGGRILATAAKELSERGSGRALISICAAGGQGVVAILER